MPHDVFYYGAVSKLQTEEMLIVEYHFSIAGMPIVVNLMVYRGNNDTTYQELLNEAVGYARTHYVMVEENKGN